MYSEQYGSKLMQHAANYTLYSLCCSLQCFYYSATKRCKLGCSTPFRSIYYCTTNYGGCMAVCKPQHHLHTKSHIAVKCMKFQALFQCHHLLLLSQQTAQAKAQKRQLKIIPEMQPLTVWETQRLQHPCIKFNTVATCLHLTEHGTTPGSVINYGLINNGMTLYPYI